MPELNHECGNDGGALTPSEGRGTRVRLMTSPQTAWSNAFAVRGGSPISLYAPPKERELLPAKQPDIHRSLWVAVLALPTRASQPSNQTTLWLSLAVSTSPKGVDAERG